MTKRRIVIAGGGTGGHITPALAVAAELSNEQTDISFIGQASGMESELVAKAGYPFHGIKAGKLRRYFDLANVTDLFKTISGFFASYTKLKELRPKVIFSKGGYVAVPVAYAAAMLHIPVVTHESDAVIGLANRLIAKKARLICTGFPSVNYPESLRKKIEYTGNPVREIFERKIPAKIALCEHYKIDPKSPIVLVIAGSQGSRAINQLIFDSLEKLLPTISIIHITGVNHLSEAKSVRALLPEDLRKRYYVHDFVGDELPEYMALADLVVSRASAAVISELAIMNKPTILIPLPTAASDHQQVNAKILAKAKAALLVPEYDLTASILQEKLIALITDNTQLEQLSRTIGAFATPDASVKIARLIEHVAKES